MRFYWCYKIHLSGNNFFGKSPFWAPFWKCSTVTLNGGTNLRLVWKRMLLNLKQIVFKSKNDLVLEIKTIKITMWSKFCSIVHGRFSLRVDKTLEHLSAIFFEPTTRIESNLSMNPTRYGSKDFEMHSLLVSDSFNIILLIVQLQNLNWSIIFTVMPEIQNHQNGSKHKNKR